MTEGSNNKEDGAGKAKAEVAKMDEVKKNGDGDDSKKANDGKTEQESKESAKAKAIAGSDAIQAAVRAGNINIHQEEREILHSLFVVLKVVSRLHLCSVSGMLMFQLF